MVSLPNFRQTTSESKVHGDPIEIKDVLQDVGVDLPDVPTTMHTIHTSSVAVDFTDTGDTSKAQSTTVKTVTQYANERSTELGSLTETFKKQANTAKSAKDASDKNPDKSDTAGEQAAENSKRGVAKGVSDKTADKSHTVAGKVAQDEKKGVAKDASNKTTNKAHRADEQVAKDDKNRPEVEAEESKTAQSAEQSKKGVPKNSTAPSETKAVRTSDAKSNSMLASTHKHILQTLEAKSLPPIKQSSERKTEQTSDDASKESSAFQPASSADWVILEPVEIGENKLKKGSAETESLKKSTIGASSQDILPPGPKPSKALIASWDKQTLTEALKKTEAESSAKNEDVEESKQKRNVDLAIREESLVAPETEASKLQVSTGPTPNESVKSPSTDSLDRLELRLAKEGESHDDLELATVTPAEVTTLETILSIEWILTDVWRYFFRSSETL